MNPKKLFCAACAIVLGATVWAAEPFEETVARAKLEYAERLKTATAELTAARTRITKERTPLAEAVRTTEARLAALNSELAQLEAAHANIGDTRQRMRREADAQRRTLGYFLSQAQETMKVLEESLLPGERNAWGERTDVLRNRLEKATAQDGAPVAMDTADLALERLERQIGGFSASGKAVNAADHRVLQGTFVFCGPETFFRGEPAGPVGVVRLRPGGEWPTVHPVSGWTEAKAGALFQGGRGIAALDATGGKALTLRLTHGSWLDEVRKGGVVGCVILAVGLLALLIAVQKILDFRRLSVDDPPAVRRTLGLMASGAFDEAAASVQGLKATTRGLFALGLQHRLKPKALLEEHLESFVLQQRMLQERRLPLLAVIATSGPLLGLLGTVTGMIKTFTLITVFGTGSAGKLSAGISEALVATKLGLMVAIPALVVHGFLSQRIQKHLAMLERYALEIATACEEGRRAKQPAEVERT
jgi:biopolymer transport protein ExbB